MNRRQLLVSSLIAAGAMGEKRAQAGKGQQIAAVSVVQMNNSYNHIRTTVPQWGTKHARAIMEAVKRKIKSAQKVLVIAPFPIIWKSDIQYSDNRAPLDTAEASLRELLYSVFSDDESFRLVERSQLQKIIGELRLGTSDIFDDSNIKKIGKLIGGDLILLGRLTRDDTSIAVNWRFADLATGEIKAGGVVEFPMRS